ncbi:hypothetical protein B0T25DRAFT_322523 [Lasiosphaeria hispida]|uniref:Uncharacterized protein n=1 Tax=Lasiosphaeria hispida TaxID=260671 RepID=A0AAJ0M9R8_9PEZI|nr:hypothetical protein B0T25DRAFT_322523 [Lasiosphaeria hispida]
MAGCSFSQRLRTGTPAQVLQTLREAIETTGTAELTSQLLNAVKTGSIPPTVVSIYIPLSRDPKAILAALEQTHSTSILGFAIKHLAKVLRSESGFARTWIALGGTPGIVRLMRELSVANVDRLCRALGSTGSALAAKDMREQRMSALLDMLCQHDANNAVSISEPRPLRSSYKHLVSACTAKVSMRWEQTESWSERGRENLYHAHPKAYKQQALQACFSPEIKTLNLHGLPKPLMLDFGFLVDILVCIAKRDAKDLHVNPKDFINMLALPLMKRFKRRKRAVVSQDQVLGDQLWDLMDVCLERHPDFAEELNFKRGRLLWLAIICWDRVPTEERRLRLGAVVQSLMSLVPASQIPNLCDFPGVLGAVSRPRRYDLLTQILRLPGKYGIDIASPGSTDKAKLKDLKHINDLFPCELFKMLPVDQSLGLVDFLSEVRPDNAFLRPSEWGGLTITSHANHENLAQGGFPIPYCCLIGFLAPLDPRRFSPKLRNNIENVVEAEMAHAAQSREWMGRSTGAKSALFLCIASGSSELYSKTLAWARRFDKDFHVVRELYQCETLRTKEGLELLCGIPSKPRLAGKTVAMVREDIRAGNKIILQLLETAAAGLQEPFFEASVWSSVGSLASSVVAHRFRFINAFQSENGLSDEEVYDLVWKPTLGMLIEAEEFTLQEEHEELGFARLQGLLRCSVPKDTRTHVWKFLDGLAKARDELWQQERIKRRPPVSTLGSPWPKGLPAHFLCDLEFQDASPNLPYVLARAKAVVFGKPTILLSSPPEDQELRGAIEGFVDDYDACLKIFVDYHNNEITDRHARLVHAWNYATTYLTGDRMTTEEARIFWHRLASFNPKVCKSVPLEPPQPKLPGPVFPAVNGPAEPAEWHPNPTINMAKANVRELDFTCLDSMLTKAYSIGCSWPFQKQANRQKITVTVPAPPSFWDLHQYEQPLSGEAKDAFVAAGILSLNSKAGSDTLLMRPYPTVEDPRFPALYLADEFLENVEKSHLVHNGPLLAGLRRFRKRAPVELICQLTSSLLSRLRRAKMPNFSDRRLAIDLLKFLMTSERPILAWDVIRDMVINRQGDSSWSRHVFTIKFFSSLPAKDARLCFEDISSAIVEGLKMQAQNKRAPTPDGDASDKEDASSDIITKPAIKVTTVKLLAEVLRGSKFMDKMTVCRILGDILASAKHIDIRVAATQSLIEVFSTAGNDKLKSTVFEYLRVHVVPAAASLDEGRVMTEEDWVKVEMDSAVPDVDNTFDRPLLGLLLFPGTMTPKWKEKWTTELLGEVLELSIENNRKWMRLFLQANDLESLLRGKDLPAFPVDYGMLGTLFRDRSECIPAEVFHVLQELVMTNLSPPPNIAAVTRTVQKDPVLFNSNAGQHWLWLFHNRTSAVSLGADVATTLNKPTSSWALHRRPSGVTVASVQEFILSMAGALIVPSDSANFNRLVQALAVFPPGPRDLAASQANARPVIADIITRIDSFRTTPGWQADPCRSPRTLPNTFQLSLQLMRYPLKPTEVAVFAKDVAKAVDVLERRVRETGMPYHQDWEELKRAVLRNATFVPQDEFLRIAAALVKRVEGKEGARGLERPGLAEHLVVELVAELIREGGDPRDEGIVRWARDFLDKRLGGSEVEVLRELAGVTLGVIWAGVEAGRAAYRFWTKYEEKWVAALKARVEYDENNEDEASELDE